MSFCWLAGFAYLWFVCLCLDNLAYFPRSLSKVLPFKMYSTIIIEFCKLINLYRKSVFSKNF